MGRRVQSASSFCKFIMPNLSRPIMPQVNAGGIPAELKAVPQWVLWRYRQSGDIWKKLPVSRRTFRPIDIRKSTNWLDFATAVQVHREKPRYGIGFVFTADDDFCGVDLDNCRNVDDGALAPWAREIIDKISSYSEISPSGTGVKIFVRGHLSGGKGRRRDGIEVYEEGRFFTVTGHHLPGTPSIVEQRDSELAWLFAQIGHAEQEEHGDDGIYPYAHLTDDEVMVKARSAKNGDKFDALMRGDWTGYRSDSEADLALASILVFWVGRDEQRVERLFSRSELSKREKWAQRADYRHQTIIKAFDRRQIRTRNRPVSTRNIQDFQEFSGSKSTVQSTARPTQLSSADKEHAVRLAITLAETDGGRPDTEVMFKLARILKGELAGKGEADTFIDAVRAFSDRACVPAEDYWVCFQICWTKVKLGAGEDLVPWAVNMARTSPVLVPRHDLDVRYALLGSFAYHLADLRKPKPFWFDSDELARLLDTTPRTINRTINLLESDGVIERVKEYVPRRYSREYLFTGRSAA